MKYPNKKNFKDLFTKTILVKVTLLIYEISLELN